MQEIDIATGVYTIDGTAVDKRRKVWDSVEAALIGLPAAPVKIAGVVMTFRHVGLKVPLIENNEQVEYWFVGGITNNHFVKYNPYSFSNITKTITSFLTNANTAARTYLFPDKSGTVALVDDVTPKADKTYVDAGLQGLDEDIQRIEDEELPKKLDKNNTQQPGRVIFVAADGSLIGDAQFIFDTASKALNINGALNPSAEFKLKVRGKVLIEGSDLVLDSTDGSGRSYIQLSGGRSALIGTFNGIEYRLSNADAWDRPDTSKSFKWRNRNFIHFQCYTVPTSFNEQGQPATWKMINEFNEYVRMPDLRANEGGSYESLVINNATKEIERASFLVGTLTPAYLSTLPVVEPGGDITGIAIHTGYITSDGVFKIKLPETPSEFTNEWGEEFGSPNI